MKLPITAVILTYNEEPNIQRCLDSIIGWIDEILVVDSYSTDKTLEIVSRAGVKYYQHRYESHPQQWHWVLQNVPVLNQWILALDADFAVSSELKSALIRKFEAGNQEISGYYVRHRQIFGGRFIRHGGVYRFWLRIFRHASVSVDQSELVDVHFYVRGRTQTIKHDLIEDNVTDRDLSSWLDKQRKFSKRAALEEYYSRTGQTQRLFGQSLWAGSNNNVLSRKKIWYRLPLYIRVFLYFGYRYFLRLGFLDGKSGFIYHFTQGFLFRFYVDVCLDDLMSREKNAKNKLCEL